MLSPKWNSCVKPLPPKAHGAERVDEIELNGSRKECPLDIEGQRHI